MTNKRLSVPGPGTYRTLESIKSDGRYYVSNFKDSGSTALRSTAYRWGQENKTLQLVPGPGCYDFTATINLSGKNYASQYESSHCRRFSMSRRDFMLDGKKRKDSD